MSDERTAESDAATCHAIMSPGRHWGPDRCKKDAGHDGWHFGELGAAWAPEASVTPPVEHHPKCYQNTGVADDLPPGLCDCKVLRMLDAEGGILPEASDR